MHDLLTPSDVTQAYFDALQSPVKAMFQVPKAGHDPNEATVAQQYRVLKERVLPLLPQTKPQH